MKEFVMNRKKRRSAVSAAAAIIAVCMLATGCGDSGSTSTPAETTAVATTAAETTAAETTAAEETTTAAAEETTAVAEETEAATEAEEESVEEEAEYTGDFTLLDITADMIDVGLYATGDNGEEIVFSMFTSPYGTPMCSLFYFEDNGQNGDVVCGEYSAETETDEDGIAWTILSFNDVYTDVACSVGFAETEDADGNYLGYIVDGNGNTYEATLLDANDTITYMGTAVAFLDNGNDSSSSDDSYSDDSAVDVDTLKSALTIGYVGADAEGSEMYWLVNDDVSFGWLFIAAPDGSDAVNVIGDIVDNGDGTLTISDSASGAAFVVSVEGDTDENGEYYLTLTMVDSGDVAVLYAQDAGDLIDVIAAIVNS